MSTPAAGGFGRAKKALGQHFLHEQAYIERIVDAVAPRPGDRLIEIGPGQGALTLPLLRRHGALTVIEFDRDLIAPLTRAASGAGTLEVIHRDVLEVDFTALAGDGPPLRVVGNLPYNISSPILFHMLEHSTAIADMHFMLQKEVVERMAAGPGSKAYGRLSVMLQAGCLVMPLFEVPPEAFRPPPKVDSAVVRLAPRPPGEAGIHDPARFAAVVRAAFGQRRKTLRNALSGLCGPEHFEAAGIEPGTRAERLSVAEFVRLANAAPAG